MWQRFTERARKVVFYAQEEAQRFGEGYVSTEHLLLGLIREPDSLGARALLMLGVGLDRVRAEVEKQLPRGESRPSQDMTLTPRGKRVIDLAYDEAREMNDNYIGTEHLFLGLVRESDGLAGRVLAKLGVRLEDCRRIVQVLQGQEPSSEPKSKQEDWWKFWQARKTKEHTPRYESFGFLMAPGRLMGNFMNRNRSMRVLPADVLLLLLFATESTEASRFIEVQESNRFQLLEDLSGIGGLRERIAETDWDRANLATIMSMAQERADHAGGERAPLRELHLLWALVDLSPQDMQDVFASNGITVETIKAELGKGA